MVKPSPMMALQPPVPNATRFCFLLAPRPEQPLLENELGPRQVRRRVDALHFVLVVEPIAFHAPARSNQLVNPVREAVSRRDGAGIDGVGAHVDLADFADGSRCLGVLDDVDDLAGGVADDASVGKRPIDNRCQQRQVRLPQAVAVEQSADGCGAEQWRVAIENQQRAMEIPQQRQRLQGCVARAERLLLQDIVDFVAQVRPHFLLPVSDHDVNVAGRRPRRARSP